MFPSLSVILIIVMIGEMTPTATTETGKETVDAVFVPDIEAETEAQVETVPADTVFAPITEAETAVPDTELSSPKMDEQNEETAQNVSKSDFDAAHSDEDLLYLAKIIENEAGSDYCTDEHQRYVASVVLNRVASPRFPGDTILEIALCGYGDGNPIQYDYSLYGGGVEGFNSIEPSERAIENARYVLENGVLDESVVWQANFEQGDETVIKFTYDFATSPTTYICR